MQVRHACVWNRINKRNYFGEFHSVVVSYTCRWRIKVHSFWMWTWIVCCDLESISTSTFVWHFCCCCCCCCCCEARVQWGKWFWTCSMRQQPRCWEFSCVRTGQRWPVTKKAVQDLTQLLLGVLLLSLWATTGGYAHSIQRSRRPPSSKSDERPNLAFYVITSGIDVIISCAPRRRLPPRCCAVFGRWVSYVCNLH